MISDHKTFISFNQLKSLFPEIPLVDGKSIQFDNHYTYAEIETESESKTHKNMRECAIHYFQKEGCKVYPDAIGVKSIFTLADFAVIDKSNNLIFVECLATNNSTQETVKKKLKLKKAGDVCFIFVKTSSNGKYPEIVDSIENDIIIFLYDYGNYNNGFLKRIYEYSQDADLNQKYELELKIDIKRKYLYAEVDIPLFMYENKRKKYFPALQIIKIGAMKKYRTKKKIGLIKSPMNHKFKVGDVEGVKYLKEYIVHLSCYFKLICDKEKITLFQNKIST